MAEPAAGAASAATGAALAYALRRLRKGWRSGELLILALALVIAVAAVSAVSLFTERLRAGIAGQTGETLGADLMFTSRDPLPPDLGQAIAASGAALQPVTTFPSVVVRGDATALASIKAVDAGYPLRGALRTSTEPFGTVERAAGVPAPGEAWADQRLWQDLALVPDAQIQVGASALRVRAVLVDEPGRGVGFSDLAPRLLINGADLPATGLLGPGARAQYLLQVAGTPEQLAPLAALPLSKGVRRVTPQEARPELRNALRNSNDFLGLARLAAALLAAAAIALCAQQWGLKLRDEVALLKCLGASQAFVLRALTLCLLLLGLVAGAVGALVGLAAQEVVARMLASRCCCCWASRCPRSCRRARPRRSACSSATRACPGAACPRSPRWPACWGSCGRRPKRGRPPPTFSAERWRSAPSWPCSPGCWCCCSHR